MSLRPLKIAWLLPSTFFYWQPSICKLAEIFPDTKIFTALWCGFAPGLEDKVLVEIVGSRKEMVYAESVEGYDSKFAYLSPKIISHLLAFKPDVVFSNSFGLWTLLALLSKPLGHWRVVIAYEGSSPSVDYRNSSARLLLRRTMLSLCDACVSNSDAGRRYLVEVLDAQPDKVSVQPYEVPDASILRMQSDAPIVSKALRKPVFLFVGHIIARKGLQWLLKACLCLKQLGKTNYTIMVVGDGPQKSELEKYCATHELSDNFHWVGRVQYEALSAYFKCADVFILPTLEDTWGVVTQEAMILGLPVLCSELAGSKELIEEGKNGYCFHPENPERMAMLMARFIDEPTLADSMGSYAQNAIKQYSPEAAAGFMKAVAENVMK